MFLREGEGEEEEYFLKKLISRGRRNNSLAQSNVQQLIVNGNEHFSIPSMRTSNIMVRLSVQKQLPGSVL